MDGSFLDEYFSLHRLFGLKDSFSDAFINDNRDFLFNINKEGSPLLIYAICGGKLEYSLPATFECRNLPYYVFLYIEKGTGIFKGKTSETLSSFSLKVVSPFSNFSLESQGKIRLYMFILKGEPLTVLCDKAMHAEINENIAMTLFKTSLLLKAPGRDSLLLVSKKMTDILTDAYINEDDESGVADWKAIPVAIREAKKILDNEYSDELSLDVLEKRIGISKFKFCREFKAYYHVTPGKYLTDRRLDAAMELLKETDITVHEVGERVGIFNTNHFINLFKRCTGLTPLSYRKKNN